MKKLKTFFKKDPTNLGRVINEIDPDNIWVLEEWIPTRKFDGTSCAIIGWELYKRYDAKSGKAIPEWAIPCQEADPITGHHPHWIKVNENDKWHNEWFSNLENKVDWTYELCWPKVQGNPEKLQKHELIKHWSYILWIFDLSFDWLKTYLSLNDIEWIVFHHKDNDGRMCKIRKSDFWIKR